MEEKRAKITKDEYERAYHEAAAFLFELYKKYKQSKLMEQEDAA